MPLKIANNAASRLAGALGSASTTLAVVPGDGAKFPVIAAGDWFPMTIVKADGTLEIVKCTARNADTFTIVRAQEGTKAAAFSASDRVELRLTKAAFEEVQAAAEAAVKKTGDKGAAILPQGLDAERPTPVPADGMLVRGNTQDKADYKQEFWDRVANVWKVVADRTWVGQQITAAVDTVKEWVNQEIGFTIIYPNGGSAAQPASIAISSRYILPNPFPGKHVICVAEVLIGQDWATTGWAFETGQGGYGVMAAERAGSIYVSVGNRSLLIGGIYSGSPFTASEVPTVATPLPCRVKVWVAKGKIQ